MTQPPIARDGVRTGDGKITRELVLATALQIIDRDGVDALSMRRLGAALDRDPMSLYRRAPGKGALLDGVVETVLAELRVDPADPDWTAQLRAVARDYRALALSHPNVVPLLVTRPLATPLALPPAAPCARSKTSSPCSPAPGSADPTRCTSTGPSSAS
jgi:AcrR family transcriptional regulator